MATAPASQSTYTPPAPVNPKQLSVYADRVPAFTGDINGILATTAEIKAINSNDDFELSLRCCADIKGLAKDVAEHYEPYCKAAKALHSAMVELRDTPKRRLDNEESRLKRLANNYQLECQAREREQQRLAEEKARREREEEQRRIEREAQIEAERLVAEQAELDRQAAQLAAQGKAAEAEQARLDAEDKALEATRAINEGIAQVEELQAEPICYQMPASITPAAKDSGASTRKTYAIDEDGIDAAKLIGWVAQNTEDRGHFLTPNISALKKHLSSVGERFNIPGVPFQIGQALAVKATRR